MHQGLDPKALPLGHSKGIHPPLVYLTATLCVKVSPHEWRLIRAQHSGLKTTDHSNASKFWKHDLVTRYL